MKGKTKQTEEWGCESSKKRLLRAVALSERLLLRRLERALLHEDEIDRAIELADEAAREEGWSEKSRKELLSALAAIRCEELSKSVSIIGVLAERGEMLRGEEGAARQSRGDETLERFEDM